MVDFSVGAFAESESWDNRCEKEDFAANDFA